MKKKLSVHLSVLLLLIVILLVSFAFNMIHYSRVNAVKTASVVGTYTFSQYSKYARYILMEQDGTYTIYSPSEGILEEGRYGNYNRENQYHLEGNSGETGVVLFLPEEDGVYYVNGNFQGLPDVIFFDRHSDSPEPLNSLK